MGTGIVSSVLTLLIGWIVAMLLTYPVLRAVAPKYASAGLALVIVGPPILVLLLLVIGGQYSMWHSERLVQEQDKQKFKDYIAVCHETNTTIVEKVVADDHPRGVVIADRKFFKAHQDDDELGRCLFGGGFSSVCAASKIDFFEAPVPGKPLWDKYFASTEPIKFDTVNPKLYTHERVATSTAKYGLILGSPEDPATVAAPEGYKLNKSKISLVRLTDGKLLAHTSIHFKDSKSGEFGCPNFYKETANMLKATFK